MKKFLTPEVDVIRYEIADVIATSGDGDPVETPEQTV